MKIVLPTVMTLMLATTALAQAQAQAQAQGQDQGQDEGEDNITLQIAQGQDAAHYLADAEGRPLYTFSTDTPATDDRQAQVSCIDTACLEVWPPLIAPDDPEVADGIDPALLGMTGHDSRQVVTYDGWPLYRFVGDAGAQDPQGDGIESFGGEWRLVTAVTPVTGAGAADIAAAEIMYTENCAQCHGRTGRGLASFPSLAGNDAAYIANRLMQYRAGETVGPNSPLMWPVAAPLSDREIANLAAFVATDFQ